MEINSTTSSYRHYLLFADVNNHYTASVSPEGVAVPRFILSTSQQQQLAEIFHLKQQQEMQQQILYQNFQQQLQALKQQQQHELQVPDNFHCILLLCLSITCGFWSWRFNRPLCFLPLSITAADLWENKLFGSTGSKGHVCALWLVDFDPFCQFLYFCGLPVVAVIIIDSGKTRKSLVGVEGQSSCVLEKCKQLYIVPGNIHMGP